MLQPELNFQQKKYNELISIAQISELAEAVQFYKRAAALARESRATGAVIEALKQLSDLYMREKKHEEELRTLNELAAIFNSQKTECLFQITLERRLGLCFYNLRKPDEAIKHLRAAVIRCESAGDEAIDEFVETLCTVSRVYRSSYKYERSKTCIKQAYDVARFMEERLDLQAAVLEELANIMYDQHRIDRAVIAFTRALKLKEQVFGRSHPQLISTHTALDMCYSDQRNFADAEDSFLLALELMRNLPDYDLAAHTDALTRLASVYRKQGRFLEADLVEQGSSEILGRAVKIRLGVFQPFDTGLRAFESGDYDQALKSFRHALVGIELEFDKRAFMRVPILCRMAEIAEERKQRISASSLHVEIEDAVGQLSTGINDVFARVTQLARLFRVLKFDGFADSCYRYAVKMQLSRPDERLKQIMKEHLALLENMEPTTQTSAMSEFLKGALQSEIWAQITCSTEARLEQIEEVDIVDVLL